MSAKVDNLVFVFVPGSFSAPWMWSRLIDMLSAAPYSIPPAALHKQPLLSATPDRPQGAATMFDDAAAIAATVTRLADDGKDVVLVLSSYAGFPGTEGSFGLSKASRTKQGQSGGIIGIVYVAAFLPSVGDSVAELNGRMPGDSEYIPLAYSPEFAAAVFNDIESTEEQKKYFEMMNNHSRVSFEGQLKHEGWKEVKCYYFWPENDHVIAPDLQKKLITKAREQGADIEVFESTAGHVPMLGREKEVADLIVKAAGL